MPDKSRSVRHQRIMDLLDNALETSHEMGMTSLGRGDTCLRCDTLLDNDDSAWCNRCHPKNDPPAEPAFPTEAFERAARAWDTTRYGANYQELTDALDRHGVALRSSYSAVSMPPTPEAGYPANDGIIQRDGHWRLTLDVDRWLLAGLRSNTEAMAWVNQFGPVARVELRQFTMDWRRALEMPGMFDPGPVIPVDHLGWAELDVFVVPQAIGMYWSEAVHGDSRQILYIRRRWSGPTPHCVLEAFVTDGPDV